MPCRKTSSATILKQWTEADDRPVTPPPKKTTTSTTTTSVFKDAEKDSYVPEEETNIISGILSDRSQKMTRVLTTVAEANNLLDPSQGGGQGDD